MNILGIMLWMVVIGLGIMLPANVAAVNEPAPMKAKGSIESQQPGSPPANVSDVKLEPASQAMPTLIYRPPLRGAPAGTVAGGTRGTEQESLRLSVLAPDHVGLTTQDQPVLYWYLSGLPGYPLEFTIIEAGAIRPLLETPLMPPVQPGIQTIRVVDYGARLKQGSHYQWFVAIVKNPEQRSKDVIASAELEVIEPSGALSAELKRAGKEGAPYLYAEEGIWYDALMAISELIASAPEQALFREQRASLLQQVGFKEVAESEMKLGTPAAPKP